MVLLDAASPSHRSTASHPAPVLGRVTLQRALVMAIAFAILAGMVPAGIALDGRLARALDERARNDLSLAPRVLADRNAASADAMMMHAKDFAGAGPLAFALERRDRSQALAYADGARKSLGGIAIVIDSSGASWTGPPVRADLLRETQAGKMPVAVQRDGPVLRRVALAPVKRAGRWIGAAGVMLPLDDNAAGVLSGITRSDVVIVSADDGTVAASTLDTATSSALASAVLALPNAVTSQAVDVVAGGRAHLIVVAPLGDQARVVFARDRRAELTLLSELRRVAFISSIAALLVALVLGALLARRVGRPVRELSRAAAAMTSGDFDAPLPRSRIQEVAQVSSTFRDMRETLAARLDELREVNAALTDRSERLVALQADLMQRDRLSSTGRLVQQLAHEIRNPVANLRNCLELIRRRVSSDPETQEFADLAIYELLRMHELAEQMLDLNRPRDTGAAECDPTRVVKEVATLSALGMRPSSIAVTGALPRGVRAAVAPDALKQVLLNLVQNAKEAHAHAQESMRDSLAPLRIELHLSADSPAVDTSPDVGRHEPVEWARIAVVDNGPGIPPSLRSRIFDPFFTTKAAVHGVGLGLFVAEGLLRTAGGTLTVLERDGGGAAFCVTMPAFRSVEVHG